MEAAQRFGSDRVRCDVPERSASIGFMSYQPGKYWGSQGKRIAYVTFEGGRSKIIIQTPATGDYVTFLGEKGINSAPAWTPDGGKLVVTLSFQKNSDLYLIDVASKSRKRLTDSFAIDTGDEKFSRKCSSDFASREIRG